MARIRRKRRKILRGGSNEPEFAAKQGGNKQVDTQFDHVEGPSNREAVTRQQAGAAQDAEMQMAMNQTGGNKTGSEEVTVPQSNATDKNGNEAMAQSAGMLMQSRQNAPANQASANDTVKTGGRRRKRKTRKGKKKSKKKGTKKRKKRKRTKRKYKFARKYHQKGCSRRSCKKR